MKKQLLFLALFISSSWGAAQSFYTGSIHEAPYQEFDNGIQLQEIQDPGFYNYTLSQTWSFFDTPTTNPLIIGANGYIVSVGSEFAMTFDPFLASLQTDNSESSGVFIESAMDESPARLSIEWRNMRLEGHSLLDFVTFKLNLFDNQVVEFHYGPSQVTETFAFADGNTGPVVILSLFNDEFTTVYDLLYAHENPASPDFLQTSGSLNGIPQPGTLYRYTPTTTTDVGEDRDMDTLTIYPNPTNGEIQISDSSVSEVMLLSSDGRELAVLPVENGRVSLKEYPKGIYLIQILQSNNRNSIQRVIKQ